VAFYSFADNKTVRASWELKTDARVSGLTRGVNYLHTNTAAAIAGTNGAGGAAIIFVGKKTDRTLLGVGRLTDTDDSSVSGSPTTITANTKSVTFTVAALECGIDSNAAKNSFFTNYKMAPAGTVNDANTERDSFQMIDINNIVGLNRQFPKFKLIQNGITLAAYSFRTVTPANFDDYKPGIIVADAAACEKKQPRYPLPGGGFQYYSVRLDERTKATVENNNTAGSAFVNPVQFKFDTNGEDELPDTEDDTVNGSVFALAFQVPVYPLSSTAAVNGVGPGTWYIRASYDSYWLDLDGNGSGGPGGSGGAVLLGMGDPALYSGYKLVLVTAPTKYQYGPNTGPAADPLKFPTGYQFLIDGLVVQLQTDPGGTVIRTVAYDELTFSIGGWVLDPGWTTPSPGGGPAGLIRDELYGIQLIKVEYIDPYSGDDHSVSFPIIVSGGDPVRNFAIDPLKTMYINRPGDANTGSYTGAFNQDMFGSGTSGTYIIVLSHSVDFSTITLDAGRGPYLIIILAAAENIKLGRTNLTSGAFLDWERRNSIYFGTWPFGSFQARELNSSNAGTWAATPTYQTVSATYPYTVNAGGSQGDVTWVPPALPSAPDPTQPPTNAALPTGATSGSRFFVASGQAGRIYNVTTAGEIHVLNRDWLR